MLMQNLGAGGGVVDKVYNYGENDKQEQKTTILKLP